MRVHVGEQSLGDQVKRYHPPDLEAENHHRVNIRHLLAVEDGGQFAKIALAVDAGQQRREMREVIDDKRQDH